MTRKVSLSKKQQRIISSLVKERDTLQAEIQEIVEIINEVIAEFAEGYNLEPKRTKAEGDKDGIYLIESDPPEEKTSEETNDKTED